LLESLGFNPAEEELAKRCNAQCSLLDCFMGSPLSLKTRHYLKLIKKGLSNPLKPTFQAGFAKTIYEGPKKTYDGRIS